MIHILRTDAWKTAHGLLELSNVENRLPYLQFTQAKRETGARL